MKKTLLASFALVVCSSAFAKMSDDQLASAMRKDIAQYLTTVKTERIIFHWTDASDITPRGEYNKTHPLTAPSFDQFVTVQGRKLYNQRRANDRDIAGPGLYMAVDPYISRGYGGEKSFGLIVGLIKPGSKIYLSNGWGSTIPQALQAEISSRGCSASNYDEILDTYNKECNAVKQLLVGRDISFASGRLYFWGNQGNLPGCENQNIVGDLVKPNSSLNLSSLNTFVVYNPNLFSKIYGITNKSKKTTDVLGSKILSYLKGSAKQGQTNLVSADQMNDASIPAMSANEIAAFHKKYILGCK